ncbi:hypothetical protein D3Z52_04250 [Clostridiaceae bacterium]|nr:hypothetical protein [Clostridiaceae bacterium]RKJ75075.1 hypothetical protein D7X33_18285 [Butyricicoccus sp. 1XD8-22]
MEPQKASAETGFSEKLAGRGGRRGCGCANGSARRAETAVVRQNIQFCGTLGGVLRFWGAGLDNFCNCDYNI